MFHAKAHGSFFWRAFTLCLTAALVFCTIFTTETAEALYIVTGAEDTALVLDGTNLETDISSRLITIGGTAASPRLSLKSGTAVSIAYNGAVISAVSRQETVTALLSRMGVKPGPLDMVAVDLSTAAIRITVASDITFYEKVVEEKQPEIIRQANSSMGQGTEKVIQEGNAGTVTATYEVIYANGQEVSRQRVDENDDTSVPRIVEYGTSVASIGNQERVSKVTPDGTGGGTLTFGSGATLAYSKVITCTATAYTTGHDGVGTRTSTGTRVRHGTVAVDPKTIPYGTKMYIVTSDGSIVYGVAAAEDTGGGMHGNRLDLYYDTYNECIQFGRRTCTVYILK